jgi:hypothetical protein
MSIEAMATHKDLMKNFFESNLKKKNNIAFSKSYNFRSKCDE